MIKHKDVLSSVAMATRTLRYHTWPMIKEQTVGEHSCRVALIYIQLFGLPRAEVLEYILKHDLGELGAGDVPFYSKRRVPALKDAANIAETLGLEDLGLKLPELTHDEWMQFKTADLWEMYERGQIEYRMGNQYGDVVSQNILVALKGILADELDMQLQFSKLWPGNVT